MCSQCQRKGKCFLAEKYNFCAPNHKIRNQFSLRIFCAVLRRGPPSFCSHSDFWFPGRASAVAQKSAFVCVSSSQRDRPAFVSSMICSLFSFQLLAFLFSANHPRQSDL